MARALSSVIIKQADAPSVKYDALAAVLKKKIVKMILILLLFFLVIFSVKLATLRTRNGSVWFHKSSLQFGHLLRSGWSDAVIFINNSDLFVYLKDKNIFLKDVKFLVLLCFLFSIHH